MDIRWEKKINAIKIKKIRWSIRILLTPQLEYFIEIWSNSEILNQINNKWEYSDQII